MPTVNKDPRQVRVEELRDLISAIQSGTVTTQLAKSPELERPLEDLRIERELLLQDIHSDDLKRAATECRQMTDDARNARRLVVRQIVKEMSPETIATEREAVLSEINALRVRYDNLSAAQSFLESGARLKAAIADATPEELEAAGITVSG